MDNVPKVSFVLLDDTYKTADEFGAWSKCNYYYRKNIDLRKEIINFFNVLKLKIDDYENSMNSMLMEYKESCILHELFNERDVNPEDAIVYSDNWFCASKELVADNKHIRSELAILLHKLRDRFGRQEVHGFFNEANREIEEIFKAKDKIWTFDEEIESALTNDEVNPADPNLITLDKLYEEFVNGGF